MGEARLLPELGQTAAAGAVGGVEPASDLRSGPLGPDDEQENEHATGSEPGADASPVPEMAEAGVFYKKGTASANAFRPWYWSFESPEQAIQAAAHRRHRKSESRRHS